MRGVRDDPKHAIAAELLFTVSPPGFLWDAAVRMVPLVPVRVSGDFHFAPTGEMTGMTAMRYSDVSGRGVITPFEGKYGPFERRDGVMIPGTAEVAWLPPEGRFAYLRGRPIEVRYDPIPIR
jgi:hypothetical protein